MSRIKHYFSLIKFSHTIFALPFALIGAFLGYRYAGIIEIPWELFIYVILCMFFARSAAMSFNRYVDAAIDKKNPRTANREIPKGVFSRKQVLLLTLLNCALFVVITYFINPLVFFLSPVALFVILGYSYAKRFTFLTHFWLGLSLSLSPIGAFLVFSGAFHFLPFPFAFVVLTWVSGFDIIYATQDVSVDKSLGLHSVPSKFGVSNALVLAKILHFLSIATVVSIGFLIPWHWTYWIAVAVFSAFIFWEHIIVKSKKENSVNMAFATMNSYAGLGYGIFVVIALLLS
jgi:4-hydroxybenzoate polyprenyltransferase